MSLRSVREAVPIAHHRQRLLLQSSGLFERRELRLNSSIGLHIHIYIYTYIHIYIHIYIYIYTYIRSQYFKIPILSKIGDPHVAGFQRM